MGFKMFKGKYAGLVLWSPFFKKDIIVTAYYTDRLWKFRFSGHDAEHWAQSKLSYFVTSGLVKGRFK